MTVDISRAVVYDCEIFTNVFTMNVAGLFSDLDLTFELSPFRDHRQQLLQWFTYWWQTETPMIGFNNLYFDYPILHLIWNEPDISVGRIYAFAKNKIDNFNAFDTVRHYERFAPQIDLLKIHHFDNRAKMTGLKALEINMRSETVMETPLPFGTALDKDQIDHYLVPYNMHDVRETKKFAHISMDAIKFRIGLSSTLRGDVLNFNDSKIGSKILEQRLGSDVCYPNGSPGATFRDSIALRDIIFPYIRFENVEFARVLEWMRGQTLHADEINEAITTKGVFTGLQAHVGGIEFCFGTGGIHGSVASARFAADENHEICDIDVAGLYPAIAIVNKLYPEHLGSRFVEEYAKLPAERAKRKKGTVENAALKLAANGTYGNSNNQYSVFYDPKFTMAITINGQLMLCMLAEWLLTVPTLRLLAINTDGITYRIARCQSAAAREVQKAWEAYTYLTLESASYARVWIRDVNNYIAETTEGKLKLKGAYWYPVKFPEDISNSSPPAWHKDFSAVVTIMAAVEHMTRGVPIDQFIYGHRNKFDFMCRVKVDRSSHLYLDDTELQRITRYYAAINGGNLRKVSPPAKGAKVGDYKRRNGITDQEYHAVLDTLPIGAWDARIHTKNKSCYVIRETAIEAGHKVAECNVASRFDFDNVNYDWYIEAARKLVIT